jgi:inhibitor of KinA
MTTQARLQSVGDRAVLVDFGRETGEATLDRVLALDASLAAAGTHGLVELVPAMTSLLVVFDPLVTDHDRIATAVRRAVAATDDASDRPISAHRNHHVVDVCYEGAFAPDLGSAASLLDVAPSDIAAVHRSGRYRVAMYGFAPGYAYLFGTPAMIDLPRRVTPGPPVPAGSVIVTGRQCLVIPVAMSTGWYAIGRTSLQVFVDDPDRPFRFDVGDTVEFRAIDAAEMQARVQS